MKKTLLLLIALLFTANFTITSATMVGYFDVVLKSVVNDYDNCRSTWTYEVTGKGQNNGKYSDLSHWVLALCEDHVVLSSNFKYEVNTDPKLKIYGIKWDVPVSKTGGTVTFSFTLDGIYSETTVQAGIKAGSKLLYGDVPGPSCTSLCTAKPVHPIVECVQPNGDGTYTAYFGYNNEASTAVTIPEGNNNFLTPANYNGNQTTVFAAGRSPYYPNAAFSVVFDGNDLTWTLVGPDGVTRTATANKDIEPCEDVPEVGSLGDKVWIDANKDGIQNDDEAGVQGITVKLYNCNQAELNSMVTDVNGNYKFENLTAGSYYVKFELPAGYVFTTIDAGNDLLDSDADAVTGKTICTTLDEGENDMSWDAGIYIPETEKNADLSLVKTVDNANPANGDEVTFTITITNNGPDNATNVEVIDLLKTGFTFVSADGSYDNATGKWTVGDLNSGESKSLKVTAKVEVDEVYSTTFDLGIAKDFNLFVFEDADMPSSDTQGRMAVGGNASLANYSVGDQLTGANGEVDVLVVGGHLQYTSGAVYGGNIVYGVSTNLPIYPVSITGGELKQGTPVDFAAAQSYLTNLSSDLSGYTVNGTTEMEWGGLKLTGDDPLLNVFAVNGADLSIANDFQITVPNGSVVLVNISGSSVKWSGGLVVHGTAINNVLYNFYEANDLSIVGIDVTGSILAPLADVNFISGVQNGQMICKSLVGMGQFNYSMFMGNIPGETTLTNIAEVSAADQEDPDSIPTNGDVTEDDYSSVTIVISPVTPGSSKSENWENIEGFASASKISSVTVLDGEIYSGTVDGKIYKTTLTGSEQSLVNNGMTTGTIWSMIRENGSLFAASEKGLFASADAGKNWNLAGLEGKDVRTLKAANGKLFAGTWGSGVFVSNNQGQTWEEINSELSCLEVQSLAVDSKGNLYAGTFGGGVLKYDDGKWNKLNVGYNHIWSLGITSSDKIYAGTYGGNVYYSADGERWETLKDGLRTRYVYAVTVDASDNVYLNTCNGGVYGLYSQNNEWFSTGMAGEGVTSIAAGSSSTLYLGTRSGKLFKSVKELTEVEENTETVPTEFSLAQNYPNPFNPSTMIQFSVPAAGNYRITVYNSLGQLVETLADNNFEAGVHTIQFNAGKLSSGIYIYRLTGGNVNISKKMMLTK